MPASCCAMNNFEDLTRNLEKYGAPYSKDPKVTYTYGTAGFRLKAAMMTPVAFRIGLLASILSLVHDGNYIGVMITASHNPVEDNGIKLVDPRGEMVIGEWEQIATELANLQNDKEIAEFLGKLMKEKNITTVSKKARVVVGRDTRPSGEGLRDAVKAAVEGIFEGEFVDLGLQTTPQLHFATLKLNEGRKPVELDVLYIEHFASSLEALLGGVKLQGKLVIDAANGIGSINTELFKNRLKSSIDFNPEIINRGDQPDDVLNENCGADFVKIQMKEPRNVAAESGVRFASLDGDADRLVYFYFSESTNEFRLLDGDRIAVLFAFFLGGLLKETGWSQELKLGVVQTAYANGGSTAFMRENGIPVRWACTGVKNLHHEAHVNFDIGVYFEANGHGTVLFSQKALNMFEANKDSSSAAKRLYLASQLINQCVGDALSDLLLVEAILALNSWTPAQWEEQYTELASRQVKVVVPDRSIYITTDADTRLAEPVGLQDRVYEIVKLYPKGRAFIRPSGTEDIVRVYAEAQTRAECDELADRVAQLLKN